MTLSQLLQVVSSAKQEFIVLIGVVGVVILLVGTIMYFVEFQIPDVCYIAVYQQFISSLSAVYQQFISSLSAVSVFLPSYLFISSLEIGIVWSGCQYAC